MAVQPCDPAQAEQIRQRLLRDEADSLAMMLVEDRVREELAKQNEGKPDVLRVPLSRALGISDAEERIVRMVLIDMRTKTEAIQEQRMSGRSQTHTDAERKTAFEASMREEADTQDGALNELKAQLSRESFAKFRWWLAMMNPEDENSPWGRCAAKP